MENKSRLANCIRALSMDAVQQANSGHPGLPMGMADVVTVLFSEFLKYNPADPLWQDRDRFVLSAGHGSMLLYSLLHLTGYEDFSIEQLKNFRKLHSNAAGHPEYGYGLGVETTTGPLGQGFANAVGMALAEKNLNQIFDEKLVDHNTYVLVGDGCLMEGISYEAAAFAGHQKLNKLIALWDNNNITIDGEVSLSSSENIIDRFKACNWHTISCDGHHFADIEKAIRQAKNIGDKPVLIACKTIIGKGSPNKAGTSKVHGAPLGEEEIKLTKEALGWDYTPFEIPQDLQQQWQSIGKRAEKEYQQWQECLKKHSDKNEFIRRVSQQLPANFEQTIDVIKKELHGKEEKVATRQSSNIVLQKLVPNCPELMGGSADLTGSNLTKVQGQKILDKQNSSGSYINYGVREHAMVAIMNGLALHKGFIPYGGTFLVFSDYCRPSIRLASLMGLRVVFVMTHDSIGVGEDGPTHQPVETINSLRLIPALQVMRPCDTVETAECWQLALQNDLHKTHLLALTRQGIPLLRNEYCEENKCRFGAYILSPETKELEITILASGSEVHLAIEAQQYFQQKGIGTRVVSVPCLDLFKQQSKEFRREITGQAKTLASIEAGSTECWLALVERPDVVIGIDSFGASAEGNTLFKHFGITSQNLIEQIEQQRSQ